MGLSVVKGIVESCKGGIGIYSEPGIGTEVRVYLPMVVENPVSTEIETSNIIEGGNERILLIDDEAGILKMEQHMLKRLGYRVTTKIRSLEALEAFTASPHAFDLIVTDMNMPEINGIQLTTEIKAARPDIPVILCTGFSDRIIDERSKAVGISTVLLKPVVRRELAEAIRNTLNAD